MRWDEGGGGLLGGFLLLTGSLIMLSGTKCCETQHRSIKLKIISKKFFFIRVNFRKSFPTNTGLLNSNVIGTYLEMVKRRAMVEELQVLATCQGCEA